MLQGKGMRALCLNGDSEVFKCVNHLCLREPDVCLKRCAAAFKGAPFVSERNALTTKGGTFIGESILSQSLGLGQRRLPKQAKCILGGRWQSIAWPFGRHAGDPPAEPSVPGIEHWPDIIRRTRTNFHAHALYGGPLTLHQQCIGRAVDVFLLNTAFCHRFLRELCRTRPSPGSLFRLR